MSGIIFGGRGVGGGGGGGGGGGVESWRETEPVQVEDPGCNRSRQ